MQQSKVCLVSSVQLQNEIRARRRVGKRKGESLKKVESGPTGKASDVNRQAFKIQNSRVIVDMWQPLPLLRPGFHTLTGFMRCISGFLLAFKLCFIITVHPLDILNTIYSQIYITTINKTHNIYKENIFFIHKNCVVTDIYFHYNEQNIIYSY